MPARTDTAGAQANPDPYAQVGRLAEAEKLSLHEIIAKRILRWIAPLISALALAVVVHEWIVGMPLFRIVPPLSLFLLFGVLTLLGPRGNALVKTRIVLVATFLILQYLGWTTHSFRQPGEIALTMLLIAWSALFAPRRFSLALLVALLASCALRFAFLQAGVWTERPLAEPQVHLLVAACVYLAMFLSMIAPLRILFESVASSRQAEQKAVETLAELQNSRNFTIQAVDHSVQLFGWLTVDGRLQFANATSLAMIGSRPDEVVGKPFWDTPWFLHAPEEQKKLRDAIGRAAGGETVRYDTTHVASNGSLREIDFTVHPIRESSGRISLLVAEGRDATEEREAIRRREQLSERLHQSQKMEVVGQLTGGIAHDFNNNLATITGVAELLKEEKMDDAKREEFLDMILKATSNASHLTRRLLSFSRKDAPRRDSILDVGAIVEDVAIMLRRTQSKNVLVAVDNQAGKALATGDESILRNAFMNLGINAFHAMPTGGRLDFRLRIRSLDDPEAGRRTPRLRTGPFLEIAIQDTGCGIPPDLLEHIFEPFFTTKENGKGTGLGLSMALDSVREMGGSLTVESEVATGTTFVMSLPLPGGAPGS